MCQLFLMKAFPSVPLSPAVDVEGSFRPCGLVFPAAASCTTLEFLKINGVPMLSCY